MADSRRRSHRRRDDTPIHRPAAGGPAQARGPAPVERGELRGVSRKLQYSCGPLFLPPMNAELFLPPIHADSRRSNLLDSTTRKVSMLPLYKGHRLTRMNTDSTFLSAFMSYR